MDNPRPDPSGLSVTRGKNNLFLISTKIAEGLNPNEVILIDKNDENKGFFERFFNFFS